MPEHGLQPSGEVVGGKETEAEAEVEGAETGVEVEVDLCSMKSEAWGILLVLGDPPVTISHRPEGAGQLVGLGPLAKPVVEPAQLLFGLHAGGGLLLDNGGGGFLAPHGAKSAHLLLQVLQDSLCHQVVDSGMREHDVVGKSGQLIH